MAAGQVNGRYATWEEGPYSGDPARGPGVTHRYDIRTRTSVALMSPDGTTSSGSGVSADGTVYQTGWTWSADSGFGNPELVRYPLTGTPQIIATPSSLMSIPFVKDRRDGMHVVYFNYQGESSDIYKVVVR